MQLEYIIYVSLKFYTKFDELDTSCGLFWHFSVIILVLIFLNIKFWTKLDKKLVHEQIILIRKFI